MKIWQRVKNLWRLSEFEPDIVGGTYSDGTKVAKGLIKKPNFDYKEGVDYSSLDLKKIKPIFNREKAKVQIIKRNSAPVDELDALLKDDTNNPLR